MDTQFVDLSVPNLYAKSTCFTYLMKLVLMSANPEAVSIIETLIGDPIMLNAQNKIGLSALMIACRNSSTFSSNIIVQMLLDAGANVDAKTKNECTALMIASRYSSTDSNIETVKMLIVNDSKQKF